MKLSKIKLKWQIFGFILGFAVIVIMLFCVFQIFMLESMYKKTKIDNIEELLTTVENKIYETVDLNDKQIINEFNKIATDAEVAIYLYDADGTECLIINNGPYYKEFSNISMFEEISKKANVINKYSKFYITFENEVPAPNNMDYPALTKSPIDSVDSSIICAKYITINRVDYLLVLDARLAPVDPAVATLKVQLIYISIIVLVLTICLALLIGHIISKPIININQSAKKLAEGKRNIVFEGKGYEEIEELNNTLNYAVEELNKTEQLQKELLANISHDLKTPITLVSGYAEMMKDLPEENTPHNLQLIIDECTRLNLLVNDLLNLSRLQSKTEQFINHKFNITSLIKNIIDRQQTFVGCDNFIFEFDFDKEYNVFADEHKISQVIYNFIINAINYSNDVNKIIIKQEITNNNCVKVSVQDFGIGISEEEIKLIWNRYYRIDKSHQRSTSGTGLGLSIVKEILDYYGLNYGVISKISEGSTFYFEIPIVK